MPYNVLILWWKTLKSSDETLMPLGNSNDSINFLLLPKFLFQNCTISTSQKKKIEAAIQSELKLCGYQYATYIYLVVNENYVIFLLCSSVVPNRDHLQRNKTDADIGRDSGRTIKPKSPHTVRPAASPPHGRPHRPHTVPVDANKPHESPNMPHLRMESGVHKSVVASRISRNPEIQPVSLPTIFVKSDHSLIELMGGRLELIAVAVPKRNIPVQWKCTLLDGQRRGRWHASERNVEFPPVNNQGKMSSGLLLPTRCRLR